MRRIRVRRGAAGERRFGNVRRRDFLKIAGAAGIATTAPFTSWGARARAVRLTNQLSDPARQPKFVSLAPNALDPGFKYTVAANGEFTVGVGPTLHDAGLLNHGGRPVLTPVWGYGQDGAYTWPGKTFEVQSGSDSTVVNWENNLFGVTQHLLPLDESLHWAYSLPGYEEYTIAETGVPIVVHLHGGRSDFQFDGNPEFFFNPGASVVGPQWNNVEGGFTNRFVYDNDVPAGNLWYHDHALGITRLNVYAGMAGLYFVRDEMDTGKPDNALNLPAFPYELAYAIQDRMFKRGGKLFYPSRPGDPFWDDFITGEGLGNGDVPKPSALAEFFGDHMVVNGKIWPKANVEPRNYRMRLVNGCDSRFLVVRFRAVPAGATDFTNAGAPIPFHVIGSDQGLASSATMTDTLVFEPGGRYDIVFDFKGLQDMRIIMENIGGDAPFGGDFGGALAEEDLFPDRQTDRIMAFDVADVLSVTDAFNPDDIAAYRGNTGTVTNTRRVALFEGNDEYGRLQPLLGTAEPATDYVGNPINWPNTPEYVDAGLVGQMEGAIAWHSPTTERPELGTTEIWEIYNATGDAHPVHLHLVNFEILETEGFTADSIEQPVVQHNGTLGVGFRLENIALDGNVEMFRDGYVENAPKDMVTALPEQVTRIKVTFDKPGRYVWHCHILSHEDHEMMRVLEVVESD